MTFTSLGSNLGAAIAGRVSRKFASVPSTTAAAAESITYA